MPVKEGNKVKVEYTGKLKDGTIFDSTDGRDAFEVAVGEHRVIPGFEKALIGMEKGEEKEFNIAKGDAYGDPNPQLVQKVPRDKLPKVELKKGMMLGMTLPNGQQMPAVIVDIDDKEATIDLNHPLAGKDLIFKIKVIDIN